MVSPWDTGLNIRTYATFSKSQLAHEKVPGGVSVICWYATPIANVPRNISEFHKNVKLGNKAQFSNKVMR